MSRWYRFLYKVGFTPWEQDSDVVGPQIDQLLALDEAERHAPYGQALDLGCGTGRWSVKLAQRGWCVTGIDVVPAAIEAAHRNAEMASVDANFVVGDVTALRSAGVGTGFSFFLDVECFNHLDARQREAMGREVNAVAAPDATLLLLVWSRARRGPLPPGADPRDLLMAFPGWRILNDLPYQGDLPSPLRGIAPRWYRMARPDSVPIGGRAVVRDAGGDR